MKTIKILFALLPLFLVFASCSNDDDEPANNNSEVITQLLGEWTLDGYTADGGAFEAIPEEITIIYEFKTGGIVTISYTYDDDDEEYEDLVKNGTYTVNNNTVTIRIDGENVPHAINQLTATSMRLAARVDVDDDEGLEDAVLYFTKVTS